MLIRVYVTAISCFVTLMLPRFRRIPKIRQKGRPSFYVPCSCLIWFVCMVAYLLWQQCWMLRWPMQDCQEPLWPNVWNRLWKTWPMRPLCCRMNGEQTITDVSHVAEHWHTRAVCYYSMPAPSLIRIGMIRATFVGKKPWKLLRTLFPVLLPVDWTVWRMLQAGVKYWRMTIMNILTEKH